jgi:hypothetical protein
MAAACVNFEELLQAFDWVSAAGPFENAAYVSRESGKIYWMREEGSLDEEELPADLEDGALYVPVPHKTDLDVGRSLALRFVEECVPAAYDRASLYFRKSGAYGRFKLMLEELGYLEAWYAYEKGAMESALREWATENDIQVSEAGGAEG